MGLNIWESILRLTLSALFGGVIGLERELRMKAVGIRTHLIVSFASCMMTLVSKYGFADMLNNEAVKLDPSRIAAGLVTAIGFLGAGAISARKQNLTGMTTAAGLWATVGIGMATGAGLYAISAFGTVFIVAIQTVLHHDHSIIRHTSAVLHIRMKDSPEALDCLHQELARLGLKPGSSKYERAGGELSVELHLEHIPCSDQELDKLFAPLIRQPYIRFLLW